MSLTHTLTHTGKRAGGNNGHKSAGEHGSPDGKGHKRTRTQESAFPQSVGKDEVPSSNLGSSSNIKHSNLTVWVLFVLFS